MSWKSIFQNITKHSDRVKKTTRPLREHFGIGYFTYHRIDHQGNYTVLLDRPDWAEHYIEEKIFLNDPYLRHPSVYRSGFALVDHHGSEEYQETVVQAGRQVMDMDFGTLLIQKDKSGVEFFGFAGNKEKSALENLYLNRPGYLRAFAKFFKKELTTTLFEAEKNSLIDLKGEDFFEGEIISPDLAPQKSLSYLRDLGLISEVEMAEKLTLRERQCLELLLQDQSARETGVSLNLSRRTVESYFESIKNKLSCFNKKEILKKARMFQDLGLIP